MPFARMALGEDVDGPSFASMEVGAIRSPSLQEKKKQLTKQNTVKVRKEFPETWLWAEDMVK